MQYTSRVSASRRELNSHEAAEPRTASQLSRQGKDPALRDVDQLKTEIVAVWLCGQIGLGTLLTVNYRELPCYIEPVNCVAASGFQSVRRAAAAYVHPDFIGRRRRRLEYVPRTYRQRGAESGRCGQARTTKPCPAHHYCLPCAALPNPSLKRSANGRPPAPGRWYAVHFHRPGAGVLPSSPA